MKARRVPQGAEDAAEKFREFHRLEPRKVVLGPDIIPDRMYRAGKAKWITYRSGKVDPETLRKPRRPVDYIHQHDAGVVLYVPERLDAGDADAEGVDVPKAFRDVTALARLGQWLGFCFEDASGDKREAKGTHPLPELYTVPDGRCLYVIQSRRQVLAMLWGGGLGVFARGIDG